ncbi:MAG: LysM peptidoglycan-binding domain-containing protein [Gemmatimonadota bacterium]
MNILRSGWSVSTAGLILLASSGSVQAQDVRADTPTTHTVKKGDTLWDLAKRYLGDAYLWPGIYRLNTDQIDDPHWIYPGEILRLPGAEPAAAPTDAPIIAQRPVAPPATTVFTPAGLRKVALKAAAPVPPPHVAFGDVVRAAWIAPEKGPAGAGKLLFGADIPGIAMARSTSNFQMFDKVLMVPPVGSVAAERERFIAYTLGETIEGVGTIVIPTALLEVVRAPRNGEAATVEVRELYGMVNANAAVIAIDTAGAGSTASPVVYSDTRTTTVRAIHRNAVLPSLDYEVLFDLGSKDGMRIGDEVELFRPREKEVPGERPAIPEVSIARAQVIRVTPYGSTARVIKVNQPAIKVGESVRITARMP